VLSGRTVDLFPSGLSIGGSGGAQAVVEEVVPEGPKSYTLVLTSFKAEGKIKVIKEVKGMLGLGLKEAKD
jgi:ribosomal protein L7/L12